MSEELKLINLPNKLILVGMLALVIFFLSLSITGIVVESTKASIAALILMISFLFFLEYVRKPYEIVVHENGIMLHFRFLKPVYVLSLIHI